MFLFYFIFLSSPEDSFFIAFRVKGWEGVGERKEGERERERERE